MRKIIADIIIHEVRAQKWPDVNFVVVVPEDPAQGDYATTIALTLARPLKQDPMAIAEILAVPLRMNEFIERIDVVHPGFLNIWLSSRALENEFQKIFEEKERYGAGRKKNGKIQVEFISANPTGPLTLGNGRSGFFGDALSRVLSYAGYEVEREYYINDAGNQIRTLGLSVLAAGGVIPFEEGFYRGDYVATWAAENKKLLEEKKDDPESLGREVARAFLEQYIRPVIAEKMNISFDRWTSEHQDIRDKGYLEKAKKLFQDRGLVYEKEGAIWLRTTDFGDGKDRVLVTGDGFPTYFLADAGHYLETKERGFSHKINVLGADHHGYVSRIQAVAAIIGFEKSDVLILQLERLVEGGKGVRMSKRHGTFVTVEEIIDDVGLDAARYFFLERSLDTHMDFDIGRARERSVKNPVYYIQYAHARMASIFRKAENADHQLLTTNYQLLKEPEELSLIKKLIQFPEIVEDTVRDYQVQRLPRYAYEVAHQFHVFYERHRVIIPGDQELTAVRLGLVRAAEIIIKNTLGLMGIMAPEKM